jgi:hypothetical protein
MDELDGELAVVAVANLGGNGFEDVVVLAGKNGRDGKAKGEACGDRKLPNFEIHEIDPSRS